MVQDRISIYRDRFYGLGDISASDLVDYSLDPRRRSRHTPGDEDAHRHLRKAAPADTLLSATLTWAAGLPSNVRPDALLSRFPRIANFIAATWPDQQAFEAYIESLLTDKRGNRQGFPVEVLRELAVLTLGHSKVNPPGK